MPHAGLRTSWIDFGRSRETGGPTALVIERGKQTSAQARLGLDLAGKGKVRPYVSGSLVHDFKGNPAWFGGTFAGALPAPLARFALASRDRNWGELSGGLSVEKGGLSLSLAADTTLGRKDVSNQAYRAAISLRF